ncbi:hypothetical protein YC2023_063990 [Brassica napus]
MDGCLRQRSLSIFNKRKSQRANRTEDGFDRLASGQQHRQSSKYETFKGSQHWAQHTISVEKDISFVYPSSSRVILKLSPGSLPFDSIM